MKAFDIQDFSFKYPKGDRLVLKNVNISVEYSEFIVICGKSGSGKTSLLRQLKPTLAPSGEKGGEIYFYGRKIDELSQKEEAQRIGYVLQNPDNQIVTDKVWHELAFGLESLGMETNTIRVRVSEMANFFGIQEWFQRDVSTLSGGQKQLLNLASVMAMNPDILILDEPTAQLDPIAATDFLDTVRRINRELGTTVIMTEQRLEEVLPLADKVIVLDEGEIVTSGAPRDVASHLISISHSMLHSMPTPIQVFRGIAENNVGGDTAALAGLATVATATAAPAGIDIPLTVREGRNWLTKVFKDKKICRTNVEPRGTESRQYEQSEKVISLKEVWFKYDKFDVLKSLTIDIMKGKLTCLVGGNGTGKSTALNVIMGNKKAYRGKVKVVGSIAMLPQNVQSLFVANTAEKELAEMSSDKIKLADVVKLMKLETLLTSHPYDLSAGEQQRLALAKVLLLDSDIILLDEPTKGMDNHFKTQLAEILHSLNEKNKTILMVSHDLEFCAAEADYCKLIFDGDIVTGNDPNTFFSNNTFYTTSANRMSRHIFENAVSANEVVKLCKENITSG